MGADDGGSAKAREAEDRRRRLAAALRDNLARRKTQARARAETGADPEPGDSPDDRDG